MRDAGHDGVLLLLVVGGAELALKLVYHWSSLGLEACILSSPHVSVQPSSSSSSAERYPESIISPSHSAKRFVPVHREIFLVIVVLAVFEQKQGGHTILSTPLTLLSLAIGEVCNHGHRSCSSPSSGFC